MPKVFSIKDISLQNKPRERLSQKGAEVLTDYELIAILINSGGKNASVLELSDQLLKKYNTVKNLLETDIEQLKKERYIGNYKASTLKAVNEICKRINNDEVKFTKRINNPKDAYSVVRKDILAKEQEYLYLLSLDSRKNLISKDLICIGSINETLVPIRDIYKKALQKNAVFIILIHNHPSNDPTPSSEDINVTQKMTESGKLLGVTFLDHIIATDHSFLSIKSTTKIQ